MKFIIWELIIDEDIKQYCWQQQKWWEPIEYEGKHYIVTFEHNVYEVIV